MNLAALRHHRQCAAHLRLQLLTINRIWHEQKQSSR
jgi:hypothetical protein